MITLDEGHWYSLESLDGNMPQQLVFVKRQGDKFPGNTSSYPGTTSQEVLRALINRTKYVETQQHSFYNLIVLDSLRHALSALETRAIEIKGIEFPIRTDNIEDWPTCKHCGHVACSEFKE